MGFGVLLLIAVLLVGVGAMGAALVGDTRIAKISALRNYKNRGPMALAWYYAHQRLPPRLKHIFWGWSIFVPTILIAKQPDLGTSLLIAASGFCSLVRRYSLAFGVWFWRFAGGFCADTLVGY